MKKLACITSSPLGMVGSMTSSVSAKSNNKLTPTTPIVTNKIDDDDGTLTHVGKTTHYSNGNIGYTESFFQLVDNGSTLLNALPLTGKHLYLSERTTARLVLLDNYTEGLKALIGTVCKEFYSIHLGAFLMAYKYRIQAARHAGGHTGVTLFMPYNGGTSAWRVFSSKQL